VTEKVIKAAVAENAPNQVLAEFLLRHANGLVISGDILMAVAEVNNDPGMVTRLLSFRQNVPITGQVLQASLRNAWCTDEMLQVLWPRGVDASIRQAIQDKAGTMFKDASTVMKTPTELYSGTVSMYQTSQHTDSTTDQRKVGSSSPIPDTATCSTCQQLTFPPTIFPDTFRQFTRGELCSSAQAGCAICSVVQQSLQHTLKTELCRCRLIQMDWIVPDPGPLRVWTFPSPKGECCRSVAEGRDERRHVQIYRCVDASVFSLAIRVARNVPFDASTDKCMNLAKN
jgi:hypothetical protein